MFRKLKPLPPDAPCLTVDGESVAFEPHDTIAAVLLRLDDPVAGETPAGRKRAPYCMMGVCFECTAHINGSGPRRTCLCLAEAGQRIERVRRVSA